jgi:prolyl oligopeptidase
MKFPIRFFASSLFIVVSILTLNAQAPPILHTKKIPFTFKSCGNRTIVDNYRWLESMNDSSVKQWFNSQGKAFNEFIGHVPGRDSLYKTLLQLDRLRKESLSKILFRNGRYFYLKRSLGENVAKLYFRKGKSGVDQLLFDPSSYLKGRNFTIHQILPSGDGNKIAIGITEKGAEVSTLLTIDVQTRELYPETIYPCWYGLSDWNNENTSFFYTAHSDTNHLSRDFTRDTKLMSHVPGSLPKTDTEIFSRINNPTIDIDPRDVILAQYSSDRKYLLIQLYRNSININMYLAPSNSNLRESISWKQLFKPSDEVKDCIFANDSIYILSHKKSSHYKIIVTSATHPNLTNARVLLEDKTQTITQISRSASYLFIGKSDGINRSVLQYNLVNQQLALVPQSIKGNVEITTLSAQKDECFLSVKSWLSPETIFDYNSKTKELHKSNFDRSIEYPNMINMEVKEVEVKSHDGASVPLSIIYPKDMQYDGNTCCLLEGYGAYGASRKPDFNLLYALCAKYHVIFAVAHIRGGGEKGENWHKAGFKQTKPNSWKDFIACAEFLINNGYTSSEKIAAEGTSAGGIIMGRAITERPDLFAAAISRAGETNPFLLETTANGGTNTVEFGTTKDSSECEALYEMDPLYHVIDSTKYPAVIVTAGMNDPRVAPWASAKFAAAVQNASSSNKPVMLRVDYNSGHSTEEKDVAFKAAADIYAYIFWALGHPDFKKE